MNCIVNDLLVNYRRQGNGRVVLLLHGWGDRLETFDQICTELEQDYELVRLDLAGFGKSQQPPGAWGLDDYADYVGSFVQKIGITPYAVVGHSNGGAVAIKAITTSRLSVEKVVLLSSAGIRDAKRARKRIVRLLSKTAKVATNVLPAAARRKMRAQLYHAVGSDLLVAPHLEETFKRIVSEDIQHEAAAVTIPTLILNGVNDTATPPSFGKKFQAAINGSLFYEIDSAGHFPHQEATTVTTALIKDFLAP